MIYDFILRSSHKGQYPSGKDAGCDMVCMSGRLVATPANLGAMRDKLELAGYSIETQAGTIPPEGGNDLSGSHTLSEQDYNQVVIELMLSHLGDQDGG